MWPVAEYQEKLFATTLPSGHVWSMQTGACVSWDREFPVGWHRLAAQRHGDTLRLFVGSQMVAEAIDQQARQLNISSDQPWCIGTGTEDYFCGNLKDVRLYRRAVSPDETRKVAQLP